MVTNIQENIRTILSSANYGTAVQCAFAWPIVASQKKDKLEDKAKGGPFGGQILFNSLPR